MVNDGRPKTPRARKTHTLALPRGKPDYLSLLCDEGRIPIYRSLFISNPQIWKEGKFSLLFIQSLLEEAACRGIRCTHAYAAPHAHTHKYAIRSSLSGNLLLSLNFLIILLPSSLCLQKTSPDLCLFSIQLIPACTHYLPFAEENTMAIFSEYSLTLHLSLSRVICHHLTALPLPTITCRRKHAWPVAWWCPRQRGLLSHTPACLSSCKKMKMTASCSSSSILTKLHTHTLAKRQNLFPHFRKAWRKLPCFCVMTGRKKD